MDKCPGQDSRKRMPEDIQCLSCGALVEVWPPIYAANCDNCGSLVKKENTVSCADWCKYAKECLGEETYRIMSESCHHNCIEELRSDHDKILDELKKLEADPEGYAKNFLDFTEKFAEPHHSKEEQVLFPALEKKGIPKEGGPIGVMLLEHEAKRAEIKNLRMALEQGDTDALKKAAANIVAVLRDHINKENNILYPMAEQVLTEEELAGLGHQCEKIKNKTQ